MSTCKEGGGGGMTSRWRTMTSHAVAVVEQVADGDHDVGEGGPVGGGRSHALPHDVRDGRGARLRHVQPGQGQLVGGG